MLSPTFLKSEELVCNLQKGKVSDFADEKSPMQVSEQFGRQFLLDAKDWLLFLSPQKPTAKKLERNASNIAVMFSDFHKC